MKLASLGQDLRYAVRTFLKQPGFTLIAVLTLALGIGANSTMFSLVHRALIRPLPFDDSDRLVMLWSRYQKLGVDQTSISGADFAEMRQARSLAAVAAFTEQDMTVIGAGEPALITVSPSSATLTSILKVRPAMGRWFTSSEDAAGHDDVVVLSDDLWRRQLGGDPAAIGRTLTLDGRVRTVIGVMPRGFEFPTQQIGRFGRVEAWVPLALTPAQLAERNVEYLFAIARLADGASAAGAQAEVGALARRTLASGPSFYRENGWDHVVSVLEEDAVEPLRSPVLLLFGAVGFVLLIACGNVSHLLLARVGARRREIALRTALGAGRGRITQQFLVESLVLALTGGALGLLLGVWSTELLRYLPLGGLPSLEHLGADPMVIGFTLALSLLTGLAFGTLPALQAQSTQPAEALKETSATTGGASRTRLRNALVTAEVALTVVLLVGGGLALRSLQALLSVPPGFDVSRTVTARITLPPNAYPDSATQVALYDRVLQTLATRPGIDAAGAIVTLPLAGGGWKQSYELPGQPPGSGATRLVHYRPIAGEYFAAMGIPLLRGQGFSPAGRVGKSREIIVDERLARQAFGDGDAVGRALSFGDETVQIVGVAANVKEEGLAAEARPVVYAPVASAPVATMAIVARTRLAPADAISELRGAIASVDRELPVYEVSSLAHVVSRSAASPRARAVLLGIFAGLATMLAALGIYGLVSHGVAQRTQEIGVRVALGATREHVLWVVVRQGLRPVLVGLAVGLAGALGLSRVMASQLYGVATYDATTYLFIALLVVVVSLAAMIVPARRALALDPVLALRHE